MKKNIILFGLLIISIATSFSQVPEKFNYQAVLRNDAGELLINESVNVRVSIMDNTADGPNLYVETHTVTTDDNGIINLVIGNGTYVSGDFATIVWQNNKKFLGIEIDFGNDYIDLGAVQLLSVPYALYANESDSSRVSSYTQYAYFADSSAVAGYAHNAAIAEFANNADLANNLSTGVYTTSTDTLFVVKDHDGNVVFAVFPDGAQVIVNETTKGKVGGFAVSGRSPSKAVDLDILRITPDSTRIYVNDTVTAKGKVGGFAVSGRSPSKSVNTDILYVTADSTRVYVNENTGSKGKVGGFAVSGRSPSKAGSDAFMDINKVNCSLGFQSGFSIDAGTNNLFLGTQSGYFNNDGNYNSFFGYRSGYNNLGGSNNLFLGYESGLSNTNGSDNTFIGYQSGYSNTTGNTNLFIGYQSGYSNTSGGFNLFVGRYSGYLNSTGSYNTFFGTQAGMSNTIGTDNLFIGSVAGVANTSGNYNIFLGSGAGNANTTGFRNTFIGYMSGYNNLTGESNTCFGQYSGYSLTDGYYNIYIGTATGGANASGVRNITIGDQTLYYNETGYQNTVIGYQSGYKNMGYGNVFLGCYAGYNETTGSNRLYIENSAVTKPLIYGEFDRNMVVINGDSLDNLTEYTFFVNGTAGGIAGWNSLSDIRLKKNIETIDNSLDKVLKLRGVNFEWKDPDSKEKGTRMGFIAQEAESVVPEVVNTEGEYMSMQYAPLTALLVEAIKEQNKYIENLENKNKQLEERLKKLEEIILK